MVAVQVLLMNYFLLGLHNEPVVNDVAFARDMEAPPNCGYGCAKCSYINGCSACKAPLYLVIKRFGPRQTGACSSICPKGFFKRARKKHRYCTRCTMRGCSECSSEHFCRSCSDGLVSYAGHCYKRCPPGTNYQQYYRQCRKPRVNKYDKIPTTDPDISRTATPIYGNKTEVYSVVNSSTKPVIDLTPSRAVPHKKKRRRKKKKKCRRNKSKKRRKYKKHKRRHWKSKKERKSKYKKRRKFQPRVQNNTTLLKSDFKKTQSFTYENRSSSKYLFNNKTSLIMFSSPKKMSKTANSRVKRTEDRKCDDAR